MTNNQETEKAGRNHYSEEFKQQALLRAVKDGVAVAARDLGLPPAQLYAWRTKVRPPRFKPRIAAPGTVGDGTTQA